MKKINKVLYLILILFFGSLGIKDIATKKYKNVLKRILLLWTGIPGLLALADFIAVLVEKSDENNKVNIENIINTKVSDIILNLLIGFSFTLFIIGSVIPWESLFETTRFTDFNELLCRITIGEYPIFNNLIGTPIVRDTELSQNGIIPAYGNFTCSEIAIILIGLSGIFALVNKIKFDEFIDNASEKIKKALPIAVFAVMISIVSVIYLTTGVHTTIINAILGLTMKFNLALSLLASLVGGLLIGNPYYLVGTTSEVFTTAAAGVDKYYGIIAYIIQTVSYLVLLFAPTSVALMTGLHAMEIPYTKWLKHIWKLLLIILGLVIVSTVIIYALI